MKIGIMLAYSERTSTSEAAQALAEACEQFGVESIWAPEHVVVPEGYQSAYPYGSDGIMPGGSNVPVPDPLLWLAMLAAHTTSVRLITGVVILPQRNPLILAKEVATLDVLSGGRAELGVGVGWLAEEYDAVGVPFGERGARADEYIRILRTLWSYDETFSGEYYRFERARSYPKPLQGSVPIHVGGHSAAAARRAGRLGDGFFAAGLEGLAELVAEMRVAAERHGRDAGSIELTAVAPRDHQAMRELVGLGATRIVVTAPVVDDPEEFGPALERRLERARDNLPATPVLHDSARSGR